MVMQFVDTQRERIIIIGKEEKVIERVMFGFLIAIIQMQILGDMSQNIV